MALTGFSLLRAWRWLGLAAVLSLGMDLSFSARTAPMIYVVGAAATLPPGGVRVAQLTDVPWSSLPPGSEVIVSAGQFIGPVTISAVGTSAKPITVHADQAADPPVINNSIDFRHAAWVQLSNMVVQSPSFTGIVIRRGSHHLTVADSVVSQAPLGINITDGAGTGHRILRNRIEDTATHGIGVDGINAAAADPTLIQYNTVLRSGQHGMEIRGSNYQIEHNVVSQSGQSSGGTSGIHIFAFSADDNVGDGNLIRYNYSYANADTVAHDGNGIQIDQWCDRNTVAFNVVWGNDGAGIIVYDGNDNQVYGNTSGDNGHDPGLTHKAWGEIIVNGEGQAGRPSGNKVYDNVLIGTRDVVAAAFVDGWAVARGTNVVGPNLMFNTVGGLVLHWTEDLAYFTAADINTVTGTKGNLVTLPSFADAAHPESDGLRLTAFPGGKGKTLKGQVDLLGQTPGTGWSYFGAYFTAP